MTFTFNEVTYNAKNLDQLENIVDDLYETRWLDDYKSEEIIEALKKTCGR